MAAKPFSPAPSQIRRLAAASTIPVTNAAKQENSRSSLKILVIAALSLPKTLSMTRGRGRIRTSSPHDCNRAAIHPHAVRLLQAATAAASRGPGAAASTQRSSAACATSTAFVLGRSRTVHLALSSLPSHPSRHNHCQARDCLAVASNGFHRLLAMEVSFARGPTADRQRGARPDPKNEP